MITGTYFLTPRLFNVLLIRDPEVKSDPFNLTFIELFRHLNDAFEFERNLSGIEGIRKMETVKELFLGLSM